MSKDKKNNAPFMLLPVTAEYCFRRLSDEQAGRLIKDLFAYYRRGVQKKYAPTNEIGYLFRSIVFDSEEMMKYYHDKLN